MASDRLMFLPVDFVWVSTTDSVCGIKCENETRE